MAWTGPESRREFKQSNHGDRRGAEELSRAVMKQSRREAAWIDAEPVDDTARWDWWTTGRRTTRLELNLEGGRRGAVG
jgi:hypothetical protein